MKTKNLYNENSIKTLSGRDHVRLRVGNYTGGNIDSTHLVKEIYYNAQDEFEIGHGNLIKISYNSVDNIVSVEDFGQGFPVGIKTENNSTIFQAACDTLNTSGKFNGEIYNDNVTGLNGQGLKITNFLSEYLEAWSANSTGVQEHLIFKDGIFVSREYVNVDNTVHGTKILWKPDKQFFQDEHVNVNSLKILFEECAAMHPKLTIEFTVDEQKYIYHSEGGINDLLNKRIKNKELLSNRFILSKTKSNEVGSDRFDIALTYTSDYSESITAYVNAALTESGVHISTFKAALANQLNKYAAKNDFLKKNSPALTQAELSEGLVVVFNLKATGVDYTGQAKEKVANIDKSLINQVMNNDFADWLKNNPKDAKAIIDKALLARKAKEAAQKAKDGIRNAKTKGKTFISLPTKLVDAYSKDRSECELFITEGDSAAANLITKRNGKIQAVFPIRGKVLSCRKASIDKIYANQEISNIVKAIGLDIDKTTGKLIYEPKKLRYSKIILAADGDIDGKNIRSLLINMFWEICKDLVINGHIYIALPPLFKITTSKNEYIFLRDEKALNEYKKKHNKEKYLVQRAKGLGEQSADEIKYCLLDPNTRNVQQIIVNDTNSADNLLECFFGTDIPSRRKFLLDHYDERNDELQIY